MKRPIDLIVLLPAASMLPVLVDSALKGAIVMVGTLSVAALLRHSPAALKHQVLVSAMAILLLLPVFSTILPGWRVLPSWAKVAPVETTAMGPSGATGSVASDFSPAPMSAVGAQAPDLAAFEELGQSVAWFHIAAWAWLLGSAVFGLWLSLSQLALWRLGRRSKPADNPTLSALASDLQSALGIRRKVELLYHPERTMPMTWGIFRTRLLLPEAAAGWTNGLLHAVLLHELAHVKRRDCLTQLLVQVTCAAHWFNPLVWVAAHKITNERERACDDLVLNSGIRASDYAEHLLRIATGYEAQPFPGVAAVAMAKLNRLEGRLTSILNRRINRRSITRRVALCVSVALAILALPVAMLQARGREIGAADAEKAKPQAPLGRIVATNPDWGFVIVDAGATDGLGLGKQLEVLRRGKVIGNLRAISIAEDQSVWDAAGGDAAPGDEVRINAAAVAPPDKIPAVDDNAAAAVIPEAVGIAPAPFDNLPGLGGQFRTVDAETPIFDRVFKGGANNLKGFDYREADAQEAADKGDLEGVEVDSTEAISYLEKYPDDPAISSLAEALQRSKAQRDDLLLRFKPEAAPARAATTRIHQLEKQIVAAGREIEREAVVRPPAVRQLSRELAHLKIEHAVLAERYGPQHPKRLDVTNSVEILEKMIALKPAAPQLSGLGLVLREDGGAGAVIMSIIDGSPAAADGKLKTGDRLLGIAEGKVGEIAEFGGKTLVDIVSLIRGKPGTVVRLRVSRLTDGIPEKFDLPLTRQALTLPPPGGPPLPADPMKPDEPMTRIPLRLVDVQEAKKAIDGVIGHTNRGRVLADVRTNSLIYIGDEETLKLVTSMLKWLDQ